MDALNMDNEIKCCWWHKGVVGWGGGVGGMGLLGETAVSPIFHLDQDDSLTNQVFATSGSWKNFVGTEKVMPRFLLSL